MIVRYCLAAVVFTSILACGLGTDGDNADSGLPLPSTGTTEPTYPYGGPDPVGMVLAHNKYRKLAIPVPEPLLEDVFWDPQIMNVAQAWADRCDFNHSGGDYGENLYVSTWEATAEEVVESWFSEIEIYDYETNTCTGACGHYTQVVWRDSLRIGCAYADCATLTGVGSFSQGRLWVCNYAPPGNWVGEWPY